VGLKRAVKEIREQTKNRKGGIMMNGLELVLSHVGAELRERVRELITKPDRRMVGSTDTRIERREYPSRRRLVSIHKNAVAVTDLESGNIIGDVWGRSPQTVFFHLNLETGETKQFDDWREAEKDLPRVRERPEIYEQLEVVKIDATEFLLDHSGKRAWKLQGWCSAPYTVEEVEKKEKAGFLVVDRRFFYKPFGYREAVGFVEAEKNSRVSPLPSPAHRLLQLYNQFFAKPHEPPIEPEQFEYADPRRLNTQKLYSLDYWKGCFEGADYAPAFHRVFNRVLGVWEAHRGTYWADDFTVLDTDAGVFLVRSKGYFEGYSMEMFTEKNNHLYEVKTPTTTSYSPDTGLTTNKLEDITYEKVETASETVEEAPKTIRDELDLAEELEKIGKQKTRK